MNVEPVQVESPRMRVTRGIRSKIVERVWQAGDRLPPEKSLMEQFQVSRDTVRAALQALQSQGLITAVPHRGSFVAKAEIARAEGVMSHTIALLGPTNPRPDPRYSGGVIGAIESGVIDELQRRQLNALMVYREGLDESGMERLLAVPPAGVVVSGAVIEHVAKAANLLQRLASARVPVVVSSDEPMVHGFDRVISDHQTGAYELTRWLLAKGCRRILRVWEAPMDRYWLKMRDLGYTCAMEEAGLVPLPALEVTSMSKIGIAEAFDVRVRHMAGYLIETLTGEARVDAILAINDLDAFAIGEACKLLRLKPGRDVLIAGYDNLWREVQPMSGLHPPAVTVDKVNHETGQELVRLLMQRIAGELPDEPQRRVRPVRLMES